MRDRVVVYRVCNEYCLLLAYYIHAANKYHTLKSIVYTYVYASYLQRQLRPWPSDQQQQRRMRRPPGTACGPEPAQPQSRY